jgi:hypothetical protein
MVRGMNQVRVQVTHVVLVAIALLAEAPAASAQEMACYTMHHGDTATQMAWRLTGNARNRYQPWFQIVDPTASRLIAKSHYDYIRPGWQACILNTRADTRRLPTVRSAVAREPLWFTLGRARSDIDSNLALWGAIVGLIALGGRLADKHFQRRGVVLRAMTTFGECFISEFERPLIERDGRQRPIDSRLRYRPSLGQFDVLLAPAAGRRYPNLKDHKQNVLYDIRRILQALGNQPFVIGSLSAQGRWVVVPFQFKHHQNPGR